MTLFGHRVVADLIVKMRSLRIRPREDTDAQGEYHTMTKAE